MDALLPAVKGKVVIKGCFDPARVYAKCEFCVYLHKMYGKINVGEIGSLNKVGSITITNKENTRLWQQITDARECRCAQLKEFASAS